MPEAHAKSILRVHRKIDSWFISRYGLNLYRGCAHACAYCDGRADHYQAPENFESDIEVKVNALEILERELTRLLRKKSESAQLELFGGSEEQPRSALTPCDERNILLPHGMSTSGFLTMGGGVSDQYQPLEKQYELAHGVLQLCLRLHIPVHILTKSTLVLRDIDLLREINAQTRAVVSISLSTVDPAIAAIVEPGAPPPQERLAMFKELHAAGIACGVFLLPVLPFLSDTPAAIEESIAASAQAGARYLLFGGLTLKPGRQADHYLHCLERRWPAAAHTTRTLFRNADKYGMPHMREAHEARERWRTAQQAADAAITRHGLARRMPPEIFTDILNQEDKKILRKYL